MAFAAPVTRGNLFYNGELYIDVGNFNRHKRASVEEISAILRPDLKKSKKVSTASPPKDQVGHWYEAQLIHYGMPPSKDKARAKMRLLEALNSSNLKVPSNITQVESELKKEYAVAERKAKAEAKASQDVSKKSEPQAANRKRKQSDISGNTNNINININLGSAYGQNASAMSPPAKKAKAAPSESGKKKTETKSAPSTKATKSTAQKESTQERTKSERPRQTARAPQLTKRRMADPTIGPGPINVPLDQRYYRTTSGDLIMGDIDHPPPNTIQPAPRKIPSMKKEPASQRQPQAKREPKVKQEPIRKSDVQLPKNSKPAKGAVVKQEAKVKKESGATSAPSLGLINGLYDISCPTVEGEWPSYSTNLTLNLAISGTTVWGAYDFGMFSGIIHLPSRPWDASGEWLPLHWRGREQGEGMMSFGDGCEGEISFLGDGEIEGWISVYGRCESRGRKRSHPGVTVRSAQNMKQEWEGYNEEAYEEERVGRWR